MEVKIFSIQLLALDVKREEEVGGHREGKGSRERRGRWGRTYWRSKRREEVERIIEERKVVEEGRQEERRKFTNIEVL